MFNKQQEQDLIELKQLTKELADRLRSVEQRLDLLVDLSVEAQSGDRSEPVESSDAEAATSVGAQPGGAGRKGKAGGKRDKSQKEQRRAARAARQAAAPEEAGRNGEAAVEATPGKASKRPRRGKKQEAKQEAKTAAAATEAGPAEETPDQTQVPEPESYTYEPRSG